VVIGLQVLNEGNLLPWPHQHMLTLSHRLCNNRTTAGLPTSSCSAQLWTP
jgi:hypothetical protein